jgi:hypothetical protein
MFIESRPMDSLLSLARELGPGVAAAQLESLWFGEAYERGWIRQMLGSLLIRRIRGAIPDGWSSGDEFVSKLAGGFAAWSWIADRILSDRLQDIVWDQLRALSPPPGWLPVVPHDEYTTQLLQALDEALQAAAASGEPPADDGA